MLSILKGLKVISTDKDSIRFENGLVLNIFDLKKLNVVYDFDKNLLESLNGKTISSAISNNSFLKNLIDIDSISSELYLKEDLDYDDLIGLVIDFEIEEDEYIRCFIHFDANYLIENSIKFEDCESIDDVLEYNENVVELFYFKIDSNVNDLFYNLDVVLH